MIPHQVLNIQFSIRMYWLNAELVDSLSQQCHGVIVGDDFSQVCCCFLEHCFSWCMDMTQPSQNPVQTKLHFTDVGTKQQTFDEVVNMMLSGGVQSVVLCYISAHSCFSRYLWWILWSWGAPSAGDHAPPQTNVWQNWQFSTNSVNSNRKHTVVDMALFSIIFDVQPDTDNTFYNFSRL